MSDPGANGNRTVTVPQPAQPPPPVAGELVRKEFGATAMERKTETASAALAAQAEAQVKARFIMALQNPRVHDAVRLKILAACKRPLFAERAIYAKPVGQKQNKVTGKWEEAFAEGLSIRFAEEAVRALGNAMTETTTIYDDSETRIIRVSATDFESNTVHFKDVTVEKTVERRKPKTGQVILGKRLNSYGDTVFIVEATEDDLLTKAGAMVSKALRDKILMLLPSDIQEEARSTIKKVQAQEDAKDPTAAKRLLIDSFAENGIMPDQLTEYIGHSLDALTPSEMLKLRAIFSAIRDGEANWSDVIEQRRDFTGDYAAKQAAKEAAEAAKTGAPAPAAAAAPPAAKGKANVNDLAATAKAKREAAATKPEVAAKPTTVQAPIGKPDRETGADDGDEEDKANRAAAAPTDDEMPPWSPRDTK